MRAHTHTPLRPFFLNANFGVSLDNNKQFTFGSNLHEISIFEIFLLTICGLKVYLRLWRVESKKVLLDFRAEQAPKKSFDLQR